MSGPAATIRLEIDCRLPGRDHALRTVEAARGVSVRELLALLGMEGRAEEIIVVYRGASVTLADRLEADGKVALLPVVCGG